MRDTCYIVCDSFGVVAMKKTPKFNLGPGERAICLNVSIPDEAFLPASMLTISADIPVELVLRPAIDVEADVIVPEGVSATVSEPEGS